MTPTSTRRHQFRRAAATIAALGLVAAACGGDEADEPATTTAAAGGTETTAPVDVECDVDAVLAEALADAGDVPALPEIPAPPADAIPVKIQLQWFTQAQFAGYYAALVKGYYAEQGLDVEIVPLPSTDVQPNQVLANGDVDFAVSWVSKALASREAGADITDIAQVFQRSGTLQVSWADAGIATPADFAGKKVGTWGFGNEYEVYAALGKAGLNPAEDVELITQNFDMLGLLNREIDAAEAMTYNEYAQLLEAIDPETCEQYTADQFTVVNYTEEGVGMLQDAIWADESRLADEPEYKDAAIKFVAASLQGWAYCRDNVQECTDIVVASGSQLGLSHQLWQTNEINKLIWPSPEGPGYIVAADWDNTVTLSQETPNLDGATVLTAAPTEGAYTNEIVEAAWALLGGVETLQGDYTPLEVSVNPGGY